MPRDNYPQPVRGEKLAQFSNLQAPGPNRPVSNWKIAFGLFASGLLSVAAFNFSEYLQERGFVSVELARIFLLVCWGALMMLVIILVMAFVVRRKVLMIVLGCAIVTIPLLGLELWASRRKPIEQIRSEPAQSKPIPQNLPTQSQPSQPRGGSKAKKNKMSSEPTIEKSPKIPIPSSITVTSNNQQGGVTAGVINVNPVPKPLLISDDQQEAIRAALEKFSGNTITVIRNKPNEMTLSFAVRFEAALRLAGIIVKPENIAVFVPSSNCIDRSGIWFIIGANRKEEANSLAVALGQSGVVQRHVEGCTADKPEDFEVVIARP